LRSIPLLGVAAGQTFVLIGAGIDLSVGSVLSLATAVASVTMEHNLILGIVLTLASGMAVGLLNGIGITKFRINPFLMTLGTTIIASGISLYIRPYPGGTIPDQFVDFMLGSVGGVPLVSVLFFALIAGMGFVVLRKSRFGRHLFATGGNIDAAKLAGIRIDAVLVTSYVISGFAAAFAGLYMTARITCGDPAVGAPFQMQSITAAVLGGTALTGGRGGIVGTVIGVVILVMLGNVFNLLDINIYWQMVLRGLILVFVVGFSQLRTLGRSRTVLGISPPETRERR
jgi:ribose transport system permease protein